MRTQDEVRHVLSLAERGHNDCEIARLTAVPRSTVRMWRVGLTPKRSRPVCSLGNCSLREDLPSGKYAYLLGQYLGDGSITAMPKGVFKFRIFTDAHYPGIIEECANAMAAVLPSNKVTIAPAYEAAMMIISSHSKHWPCLIPQHGPGRRHLRRIALEVWQVEIVQHHPEAFLRGLIHSDGCRVINRIKKGKSIYAYPRYNFINMSDDIMSMFTDTCDQLGVEWKRMNYKAVSIARRESVAMMETFVGPKM